ncbi:D,D-dipeptide-binding periplasmic protein ddpA [Mycolicibacterium phlei]|nr:peptide ABC transporter substrate-binding protein [Mycobacteroides chelonae]ORV17029.1 peptide ABC transporter substrate-binding protein [Mycobacteroides chelonae]VEG14827.1 D,D-dipeptide-binding periplasmic protein ddpA [Mycolicibacterium phlei]
MRKLAVAASVLLVAGCGVGRPPGAVDGEYLTVGTTDRVSTLDPAGAYDNGSFQIENQVYPFLMNFTPGTGDLKPDLASSCGFKNPTVYSCTLKPGSVFANGHKLTSSDVKYSYDRERVIDDPNGPQSLLANLDRIETPDDLTVDFRLKLPNDQTFPQVLATNAGPIIDEEVFPPDRLLDDDAIARAEPFAGPYTITSHSKNQLIGLRANPTYIGGLGKPQWELVGIKYYTGGENLKIDIENRAIDIAYRSLSPNDIETLRVNPRLAVHEGPGGELRYIVFNLKTMPGGTDAQKLAVRKAVSSLVDREALSRNVYKGIYTPAYSVVPDSMTGATESFKTLYGAKPNVELARKFLSDAKISVPVLINLQYNPDHYGSNSSEEYAAVKGQLESSGLFRVDLQSTEWVAYQERRSSDSYPVYQFGWFPDFPDPDNYLTPFFMPDNMVVNHFENDTITRLITAEATEPDRAKRLSIIGQIQDLMARDYISTLPLLTGKQIAVSVKNVEGIKLGPSFKFQFTPLKKTGSAA